MTYLLAIDSGNSYVKWGLHDGSEWIKKGKVFYDDVYLLEKDFIDLPKPMVIIISHVARNSTRNHLITLVSIWPTKPQWICTKELQCGVSNGYLDPKRLGSDRWAALIAAWRVQHRACLVINVGTAMTIDVLSGYGKFLGGIILPGFHLMYRSLLSGTQLKNDEAVSYQDFPDNTKDAIYSGVIHSLLGAIERMHNLFLIQIDQSPGSCIISGGGASVLMPFIKFPVNFIDNLVLEGLVIIAEEFQPKNKSLLL